MSTSQATQATEAIDTPITLAQFLKNWVAGRYRNLIDWGTTDAGTRVTAELKLFDKKGKVTGQWRPLSLLITDLTSKNVALAGNTATVLTQSVGNLVSIQVAGAPPTGKSNWKRITVQNIGGSFVVYIGPSATVTFASAWLLPSFTSPPPSPLILENLASSLWAATSTGTTSIQVIRQA